MLLDKLEFNNHSALHSIIDEIDAVIYVIDAISYEILYANKKCITEFGDIIGQRCFSVLQENVSSPCGECSLSKDNITELENNTFKWEQKNSKNNKTYFFSDKIIKLNDKPVKVQIGIDITAQKQLEEKINLHKEQSLETFETLTNSTIEGLIIYDEHKECYQVNKVAPELLGYKAEEMIGMEAFDFVAPESMDIIREVIHHTNQEPYEAIMLRKDGSTFPALLRGKDIKLNGKELRVSAILDITQIKEKERIISDLAYYDSLTSLPNRVLLSDRVNQLLLKNKRTDHFGALMFIDLDHFKIINDTKGHISGDKILVDCAKRLKNTIRGYDTVSRFGGDEFIVLIDTRRTDKADAINDVTVVANKILRIFKEPFYINTSSFQLSASIGISLFNSNITFEEILKRADSAMYHSKDHGRNRFNFFDPQLQQKIERKALVLERLRKAIKEKSIQIYYQKQVDTNEKILGFEALARWNDEILGNVSPIEFIPLAEESGLIIEFGTYLIQETGKLLQLWAKDKEKKEWKISINISLSQFEKENFIYIVEDAVEDYNIPKNRLRLEITESILLKNVDRTLEKIQFFKNLGISISIDDFGTGYSSLSYLKKLSIDELKIDKSFVEDILTDENDETIILAIISIANKFGIEIIAEGVETQEVFEKLKELGCHSFQGYYFSKPLPLEQI